MDTKLYGPKDRTWAHPNERKKSVADTGSIVFGIAGRYALALYELAEQEKAVDIIDAELGRFLDLLNDSDDLRELVRNPVFSAEDQTRAVSALLDKVGLSGLGANFIKLVASKRRLFAVRSMIDAYRVIVADKRGLVSAEVTVAEKLNDANRRSVEDALNGITGKTITLIEKVDPAIIGGLIVKMGSKMVDSSVRTKLNSIKLAMKEVG